MENEVEEKISIVTDNNINMQGQINFKPTGYFSMIFNIILIYIAALAFGVFMGMKNSGNLADLPYLISITLLALAAALIIRHFTRKKIAPSIQFSADEIIIPRWYNSKNHQHVPYSSLKSIDIRGKNKNQMLVIGTSKKTYIFSLKKMTCSKQEVEALIKSSILNADNGEKLWITLNESQENSGILMKHSSMTPIVLCLVMIAIFVGSRLWGNGSGFLDLVFLGGNSPVLVNQGQWDRLFTSNFLHIGLLHLYFNAIGLFVFGNVLEKLMGRMKFLLVFLVACIGGAIASYLASRSLVSVGASGGIFGLMGSLLFINWKMGFRLPAGFNLGKQAWIIMLGLNGGLPFLIPQIDWVAHLGGFVLGIAVTWLLLRRNMSDSVATKDQLEKWRVTSPRVSVLVAVVSGLFLFSFFTRVINAENHRQDVELLIADVHTAENMSPSLSNTLAWGIVTGKDHSTISLTFAKKLMLPVIDDFESPDTAIDPITGAEYLDTYASILYLQGDYLGALESEYKAMDYSDNSYYESQVSRFLSAKNAGQGPWIRGTENAANILLRESSDSITLVRTASYADPVSVIIHVRQAGVRKGYFVCILSNVDELQLTTEDTIFGVARTSLDFNVAAIDTLRVDESMLDTCSLFSVDGLDGFEAGGFLDDFL